MSKSATSPSRRCGPAELAGKPLTTTQRQVMLGAAARPDHAILPLPINMPQRGAAPQRLLASLLDRRLIAELPCDDAARAWRTDAAGCRFTLCLTATGLAAAGTDGSGPAAEPAAAVTEESPETNATEPAPPTAAEASAPAEISGRSAASTPALSGKLGQILTAISAPQGATLSELVAQTGWLLHTTRAALTRLRQRGHPIRLVTSTGRKAYHLAADAGMAADAGPQP